MQIIGFNFTKVIAEKSPDFSTGSEISTNIDFSNIEKEETELTKEGSDAIRTTFEFKVSYGKKDEKDKKKETEKNGEITLRGFIILLASKEEAGNLLKDWKKKELSPTFKIPIFNFILNKCSTRALQLEEELNLPLHIPMPRIRPSTHEEKK